MPRSYACLHYHIIFSTRKREPLIHESLATRLYEYFGGILKAKQGVLLAAAGMPDHVHLLAGLSREMSVSETLRILKSNSSGWIHENFPELKEFAWQNGYGAFTVSYSADDAVKRYIANQREHHRTQTYQEEFVEFLKRHHIEYDERYLWD